VGIIGNSGVRGIKFEARNPESETSPKPEVQMSQTKTYSNEYQFRNIKTDTKTNTQKLNDRNKKQ